MLISGGWTTACATAICVKIPIDVINLMKDHNCKCVYENSTDFTSVSVFLLAHCRPFEASRASPVSHNAVGLYVGHTFYVNSLGCACALCLPVIRLHVQFKAMEPRCLCCQHEECLSRNLKLQAVEICVS